MSFGGDVLDLSLPARLVADVVAQLGGLHVLINNASIQIQKPWMETSAQEMEKQLRAELISPIVFIQQVWPIFKRQGYGRIINLGSVQQRRVNPGMLGYSLSKGAMEKFTMGLFEEMAAANVTINQIAPGWINTYRNRESLSTPEIIAEAGKQHVPIGRIGEPGDFKGIVAAAVQRGGELYHGREYFCGWGAEASEGDGLLK